MNRYPPELLADGRRKVQPIHVPPGTNPLTLSRAQCRRIIDIFQLNYNSNHSAQGGTLWVVLYYCQWAQLEYTLTCVPGIGYFVKAKPL